MTLALIIHPAIRHANLLTSAVSQSLLVTNNSQIYQALNLNNRKWIFNKFKFSNSNFLYFVQNSQGTARTQSPTTKNYTPESTTFVSIAGVSPIRSAMDKPHPGGTTLEIMVTPEPGKYASAILLSPFCKLAATENRWGRNESYSCTMPIRRTYLWRVNYIQTKQQSIHFKVQCLIEIWIINDGSKLNLNKELL